MATDFSDVLAAITPTARDELEVVVPPDWLQGRSVFGGLQMALAVRGMRAAMPAQSRTLPLRCAQVTFVGPLLGDARIVLRPGLLRRGRSTLHARCDLLQDGAVACTAVAIFGVARPSQFVQEMPAPDPGRRPEDVVQAEMSAARGPAFIQHFQTRWAVGDLPFTGYPEPRSMIYARLRDRDCGAEDALLALADVIPTPVLSMLTQPTPASSLSWMIEVLRDPAQLDLHGWCLLDTEVRAGTSGYLSQTSVLYGPDRHAYAVSHQTVGVFG
jgi:acyl-CoA thioesterase